MGRKPRYPMGVRTENTKGRLSRSQGTKPIGLVVALALALGACARVGSSATPTLEPARPTRSVESVEVLFLGSFPVQVSAVVGGFPPDGCVAIDGVGQVRDGNSSLITLTTARPAEAVCSQSAAPYEKVVELDVASLPKGVYTVTPHGASANFELTTDNALPTTPSSITGRVWHDLCASGAPGQPGPATALAGTACGSCC